MTRPLNPEETVALRKYVKSLVEAYDSYVALRDVASAAVEWVEAHAAMAQGSPSGRSALVLERYATACAELLAIVSQNRDALRATLEDDR